MGGLIHTVLHGLPLLAAHHHFFHTGRNDNHHSCAAIAGFSGPVNHGLNLLRVIFGAIGVVFIIAAFAVMIWRHHHPGIVQHKFGHILVIIVGIVGMAFVIQFLYLVLPKGSIC